MGAEGSSTVISWEEQTTWFIGRTAGLMFSLVVVTAGWSGAGLFDSPPYEHWGSTILYCAVDRSQNLSVKEMVVGVYKDRVEEDQWNQN